ncbi:prephenate dehydrogenase/arogenate dehydrogenase family protein [Actinocrispum wychmicini]|uniref:Prephenate dehydrogenase n=1 Tax=Actinocrispum wychmicini TaxID=1213861 RepID=A0A4R2JCD8_9PSEU|nr:prephenate dehydrogenase/arogenate dehydrogenase family protein [Actinocrispum wychmicini]TCO56097.1 prephenate dehydrogenase [Actinocrispum wychmicini]
MTNFVVCGGAGSVGGLFCRLFGNSGDVVTVDREQGRHVQGDVTHPSRNVNAVLATADVVLLALPEKACEAAIPVVASTMRAGALLADTSSVKATVAALLAEAAERHDLETLSLNPMFAPTLDPAGRPVATVTIRGGPRTDLVCRLLRDASLRLVPVTADEHDHLTALTQVATHASVLAFGQALVAGGCDVDKLVRLAPPPHLAMLALLARIVRGSPEVYWDIQAGNAEAERARQDLRAGLDHLSTVVTFAHRPGFARTLDEIADKLGPCGGDLAARCAEMLARPELGRVSDVPIAIAGPDAVPDATGGTPKDNQYSRRPAGDARNRPAEARFRPPAGAGSHRPGHLKHDLRT